MASAAIPETAVLQRQQEADFSRSTKLSEAPKDDKSHTNSGSLPSFTVNPVAKFGGDHDSQVFCVRFSPDSNHLAAGCGDGRIRIYSHKGQQQYLLGGDRGHSSELPVTCLRWRPTLSGGGGASETTTRNVLLAANADGSVSHWHVTTQKCLYKLEEDGNQVYALDYNPSGTQFATGGRDHKIRIYEEATKTCVSTMFTGAGQFGAKQTAGHSNRVFAVKFKADDPHVVLSGGWDNTVQIWDTRTGMSERSIFGPHLAGDALDIHDNQILTGSWRPEKPVELWDFGSGKRIRQVPLLGAPMVYAAQFHPSGDALAVGGSGSNEARVLDKVNNFHSLGPPIHLPKLSGIYSLDFSPNCRRLAVGGSESTIEILQMK